MGFYLHCVPWYKNRKYKIERHFWKKKLVELCDLAIHFKKCSITFSWSTNSSTLMFWKLLFPSNYEILLSVNDASLVIKKISRQGYPKSDSGECVLVIISKQDSEDPLLNCCITFLFEKTSPRQASCKVASFLERLLFQP